MASPPTTPTYSRRQSADYFGHSPPLARTSSSHSRRSSAAYSPVHSRLGSSHGPSGDSLAQELGGFGESLENELDGWNDEDYIEEEEEGELSGGDDGEAERERDSGIDVLSSPSVKQTAHENRNSLTVPVRPKGHQRKGSDYDGSEYGSESDFEESQLVSASLEARLAAVESLARRGTGDIIGQENPITRATEQFKDLGGQSGIETGVTRLTTAHAAISTHLTHQVRLFQQLTSTLFSPFAPPLDLDTIESILPALTNTISFISNLTPTVQTSEMLHTLSTHTKDLIESLSALSDSVHMMRQTSLTATRRLRAVKDTLREWRSEWLDRDDGVRYIEQGCWDQRLRNRECASVCREVLGGFEQTCDMWRARLVANAAAAVA